jgi:hypothetical protein
MEGRFDRQKPLEGHRPFAPFLLPFRGLNGERFAHQPVQEI